MVAILTALALYLALPSTFLTFLPGLRYIVAGTCLLLLVPVIAVNPVRMRRQTAWSRRLSVIQAVVLVAANQLAMIALLAALIDPDEGSGARLLLAAAQVWLTNVIAFALVLWEIDRGGPVLRSTGDRSELPTADIRYPQDEDHEAVREVAAASAQESDWRPRFGDYLYTSASNSMAFSASDSMPLSHRAKALMGVQAFSGFVILALVIARGVSLLGG